MMKISLVTIVFEVSRGVFVTLGYTCAALILGLLIAAGFTYIRVQRSWGLFLVSGLVDILRGTPVLVQLLFFYYCLPFNLFGPLAATLAFALNSAAYTSEILRGGINSISRGQFQACHTLGIPKFLMWKDIIIPQLLRVTLPTMAGEFSSLVKETAILSFIGEADIMQRANSVAAATYSYAKPILVAGCFYYLICKIIIMSSKYLEKRVSYYVKSD